MTDEQPIQPPAMPPQPVKFKVRLFDGMRRNKKYVLKASILVIAFWFIEFMLQYYGFSSHNVNYSLIRASSFTAATLISLSLITGPLARLSKKNYTTHRRTLGVWGFCFAIVHVIIVFLVVYNFSLTSLLGITNPFINPALFGFIAFIIFLPLYLTSTDWAINKLGSKTWKNIHRLVYIGYIVLILHYLYTNTLALYSIPGYILLALTVITLLLELTAFAKTIKRTKNKKALLVGILIILFAILMFSLAYFNVFLLGF